MKKQLSTILVTPTRNGVGVSLVYSNVPSEHLLLPLELSKQLKEKLTEAIAIAESMPPAGVPADRVGVSDAVSLSISPPSTKGH